MTTELWHGRFWQSNVNDDAIHEVKFEKPVSLRGIAVNGIQRKEDMSRESDTKLPLLCVFAKDWNEPSANFKLMAEIFEWNQNKSVLPFQGVTTCHLILRGDYSEVEVTFLGDSSKATQSQQNAPIVTAASERTDARPTSLWDVDYSLHLNGKIALQDVLEKWESSETEFCISSMAETLRSAILPSSAAENGFSMRRQPHEAAQMVLSCIDQLANGSQNSLEDVNSAVGVVSAAKLICLDEQGLFRFVIGGGLQHLLKLLQSTWDSAPQTQLSVLQLLTAASRHAYVCHILLGLWAPGSPPDARERDSCLPLLLPFVLPSSSERHSGTPYHSRLRLARETAVLLSRLHTMELAFKCQRLLVEGPGPAPASQLSSLSILLTQLVDCLTCHVPSEAGLTIPTKLQAAWSMAISTAMEPAESAFSDEFKPPAPYDEVQLTGGEICPVLLHSIQASGLIPLLPPFLRRLPRQAVAQEEGQSLVASLTSLILTLLSSPQGLAFMAADKPSFRSLQHSLTLLPSATFLPSDSTAPVLFPGLSLACAVSLLRLGVVCHPVDTASLMRHSLEAVSRWESFVSAPVCSEPAHTALLSICSLSVEEGGASAEAVLSAMRLPKIMGAVLSTLSFQPQFSAGADGPGSPSLFHWQCIHSICYLLRAYLCTDQRASFLAGWLPHSVSLWHHTQRLLHMAYPSPGCVGQTAVLLQEVSALSHWGALYQTQGLPAVLECVKSLTDQLSPASADSKEVAGSAVGTTGAVADTDTGRLRGEAISHVAYSKDKADSLVQLKLAMTMLGGLCSCKPALVSLHERNILPLLNQQLRALLPWVHPASATVESAEAAMGLLLQALRLLLAILEYLKQTCVEFHSKRMSDVLVDLMIAISAHNTLPAPISGLLQLPASLSLCVQHCLSACMACWSTGPFQPSIVHSLTATLGESSSHDETAAAAADRVYPVCLKGPLQSIALCSFLCDIFRGPEAPAHLPILQRLTALRFSLSAGVWLSSGLPQLHSGFTLLPVPQAEKDSLLASLKPRLPFLSKLLARLSISPSTVENSLAEEVLACLCAVSEDWGADLVRPLVDLLRVRGRQGQEQAEEEEEEDEEVESGSEASLQEDQLCSLLRLLCLLASFPSVKLPLLREGICPLLLRLLPSPAPPHGSNNSAVLQALYKQPADIGAATSVPLLALQALTALCQQQPQQQSTAQSTESAKVHTTVTASSAPSLSDCRSFSSWLLLSLDCSLWEASFSAAQPLLQALLSLCSSHRGRAATLQVLLDSTEGSPRVVGVLGRCVEVQAAALEAEPEFQAASAAVQTTQLLLNILLVLLLPLPLADVAQQGRATGKATTTDRHGQTCSELVAWGTTLLLLNWPSSSPLATFASRCALLPCKPALESSLHKMADCASLIHDTLSALSTAMGSDLDAALLTAVAKGRAASLVGEEDEEEEEEDAVEVTGAEPASLPIGSPELTGLCFLPAVAQWRQQGTHTTAATALLPWAAHYPAKQQQNNPPLPAGAPPAPPAALPSADPRLPATASIRYNAETTAVASGKVDSTAAPQQPGVDPSAVPGSIQGGSLSGAAAAATAAGTGTGRAPSMHVDQFMARQRQQGTVLLGAPVASASDSTAAPKLTGPAPAAPALSSAGPAPTKKRRWDTDSAPHLPPLLAPAHSAQRRGAQQAEFSQQAGEQEAVQGGSGQQMSHAHQADSLPHLPVAPASVPAPAFLPGPPPAGPGGQRGGEYEAPGHPMFHPFHPPWGGPPQPFHTEAMQPPPADRAPFFQPSEAFPSAALPFLPAKHEQAPAGAMFSAGMPPLPPGPPPPPTAHGHGHVHGQGGPYAHSASFPPASTSAAAGVMAAHPQQALPPAQHQAGSGAGSNGAFPAPMPAAMDPSPAHPGRAAAHGGGMDADANLIESLLRDPGKLQVLLERNPHLINLLQERLSNPQ